MPETITPALPAVTSTAAAAPPGPALQAVSSPLVTADQSRGMVRLMATAGIVPETTPVRSGEDALVRITGRGPRPAFR